jgi:hypothetical protein
VALGYAVRNRSAFGDLFVRIVDLTFDASYASGGYTLDPKSCGFGGSGTILMVDTSPFAGFLMEYNPTTGKVLVRDCSGAAGAATPEVANNLAGLNGLVARVIVYGKGQG